MVELMAKLFSIVGLNPDTPVTLQLIFPYLLKCSLAFCIIGSIFAFIGNLSQKLIGGRL